jgi:hypothetical protein
VLHGTDPCNQHQPVILSTLFPVLPTRSNHRSQASLLPPIELGIKGVPPSRRNQFYPFRSCDVKCHFLQNQINTLTILLTIQGTNWEIGTSMEGPQYYASLKGAPASSDQYLATTSFDSEMPMPYFSWDECAPDGKVIVPCVDYDKAIRGAVFMARNYQSRNGREVLVKDLIQMSERYNNSTTLFKFPIDSVSRACTITILRRQLIRTTRTKLSANICSIWHLKIKMPMTISPKKTVGNSLPNGVRARVRRRRERAEACPAPFCHQCKGSSQRSKLVRLSSRKVVQNRTLYESYRAWRYKPLPDAFVRKYNFTHVYSTCRMCRWAFAKRYGWGWEHEQQAIKEINVLA